jgi:hypothetical protein
VKLESCWWTPDEKAELDRPLDAGREAAEIAVALNRKHQLFMRDSNGSTEKARGKPG